MNCPNGSCAGWSSRMASGSARSASSGIFRSGSATMPKRATNRCRSRSWPLSSRPADTLSRPSGGLRARYRNAGPNPALPSRACAATTSLEPIGSIAMANYPDRRGPAMFAGQATSARSHRPRSAEDESPLIVTSIAILGVVVLTCVGLDGAGRLERLRGQPGATLERPGLQPGSRGRGDLLGQNPPASVPAGSERRARAAYSALMRMAGLRSRIHMRPCAR